MDVYGQFPSWWKRRVLIGKQYKDNFHLYTWEKHGESEKNRD